MQTSLAPQFKDTPAGQEADAILRSCVHCGFCTATCPTYQLLGDELDSPRGRIYLIKQVLEGASVTAKTQQHLDRCLTCRSCETTCPSGVQYGRLVDIGRHVVEQQVPRSFRDRLQRRLLRAVIPHPRRFAALLRMGQHLRPLLPASLRAKVPARATPTAWPAPRHARRMLVLEGCAQSVATPNTDAAAARLLDRLGISLVRASRAGCCGAMSHHLAAEEEALTFMRRNIDAWWPHIEGGAEAVVVNASGCAVVVRDYGRLLAHDPAYASKAARVSALAVDLSEILIHEDLSSIPPRAGARVAFHSPCTLQHGMKIVGRIEALLKSAGYILTHVPDAHLCCGSAGTYSLLQPELSRQLLVNKVAALASDSPEVIATANVGCQLHMATRAGIPVRHWIELMEESCADRCP